MSDETVRSAELLLRWEHPKKGILSPDAFIPLAVEAGLLSQITWWLIDELCGYIERWKKEGVWKIKYVSININAQQLIEKDFATTFLKKLEAHHIETKDIMIEITERSLIDNFESTQAVINHLRSKGVRCAIDDFGIGYSSLSYLKKLSFNTLKIDKEFVKNIESEAKERTLMKTILDIGRQFNYNIVIEGLENRRQKEILEKLDPELYYQGHLFSRALPVKEFLEKYLKNVPR
jgi:EAL domain-containing protein (putative c-di-GMP-specific phosphodiesterase class I)